MKQASKQSYYNDLVFQGLFYIPMMFLYVIGFIAPGAFIIGMILQFFVGCAQVISGIFHTTRYQDEQHKNYLTIAIAYLVFLFLGGMGLSNLNVGGSGMIMIVFLFIIPVGIATWYYRLTWLAYKNAEVAIKEQYYKQTFQEDVLDDILL